MALVEVAVQGLDAPILARVRESDAPPQGSEIGVGVDAGAVLVFEAENGELKARSTRRSEPGLRAGGALLP